MGNFSEALKNGKLIVTAECRPPRGSTTDSFKTCATALGAGATAIYAPESEDGVRQSSLAACSHLAAAGAEPILGLLTRDSNRIALQSAILGAVSMGVENVMCMTGRHQTLTTSSSAKGVFDVDAIQLLSVANAMRKDGVLANGQVIDSPLDLVLGTDTNPFADPMELQVIALEKAVKAGADFVITQPVFNREKFETWMSSVREKGISDRVCVIAAVMPLESAEDAASLAEKYPSLDIPAAFMDELKAASDQKAAGLKLAVDTIAYLRGVQGVRGIHLMNGDNTELASQILKSSGLLGS